MATKKQPVKVAKKVGRPSAWLKVKDRISELVELYAGGATIEQLAKRVGVGTATFNRLKADFKELRDALAHARDCREEIVVGDMWRLARGCAIRVEKIKRLNPKTGKMEIIGEREIHLEPQLSAQLAFLKQYHGWSDNPVRDNAEAKALNDQQLRENIFRRHGLPLPEKPQSDAKDRA